LISANLVIADMNLEVGQQTAKEFEEETGNKAIACEVDQLLNSYQQSQDWHPLQLMLSPWLYLNQMHHLLLRSWSTNS
jgi:hypothetical protein